MLSALKCARATGNGLAASRQLCGAYHPHYGTFPRHITMSSKLDLYSGPAGSQSLSGGIKTYNFLEAVRQSYPAPANQRRNAADEWRKKSEAAQADVGPFQARDAYQGRSVIVSGGDVANAYRRLNSIIARNNVRRELSQTARHEKRGTKRRRLASQQWRTRFSHEVRKKVQLVQAIRRRSG